ncbi:Pantothenate kinase type III, CoaX-like [hydrothermal vent metagenome]|uniref:Type III pantothenate kinase n=1 Tax=hydrothermal vent metagenome TaxID=652676 RepID=A0A1W1DUX0_9ZZZZ
MDKTTLFIDVGNTAVKWLFDGDYQSVAVTEFSPILLPKAKRIFVSCVGDKMLLEGLKNTIFVESQATFNIFKSAYKNADELGVDRFLAMIATINQYPDQTRLIVDAGSALTFDLVLADGTHQGGLIMPGLGKLRRSFDQFCTESQQLHNHKLADNTSDAWACGTGQMFTSVINAQIEHYLDEFGDLVVVLSGGDSKLLALRLSHAVKLQPNLVLEGLSIYAQTLTA